eukprot:scaffold630_cov55-Isochrysis_galbana.AAC.1
MFLHTFGGPSQRFKTGGGGRSSGRGSTTTCRRPSRRRRRLAGWQCGWRFSPMPSLVRATTLPPHPPPRTQRTACSTGSDQRQPHTSPAPRRRTLFAASPASRRRARATFPSPPVYLPARQPGVNPPLHPPRRRCGCAFPPYHP